MWGKIGAWLWKGGSALTGAGVLVAGGATTEVLINGKDSLVVDGLKKVQEGIGGAGAQANADITKTGLFSFFKMIGELMMVLTNGKYGSGLINLANKGIGYDSDRDDSPSEIPPPVIGGPDMDLDPTTTGSIPTAPATDVAGSDVVGLGTTGVVAGTMALTTGIGIKSVPVLSSVYAAATGIWDTGAYLIEGDLEKAGVRFTSGVADTVLSAGGALSLPFATAAREGIEEGAQLVLGDHVDMPDSDTLAAAKGIINITAGRALDFKIQ